MAEVATKRLNQAAKDLNVGTSTIVDFLAEKGIDIDNKPTTKLSADQVRMLNKAFESSVQDKIEAAKLSQAKRQSDLEAAATLAKPEPAPAPKPEPAPAPKASEPVAAAKPVAAAPTPAPAAPPAEADRVPGLKVLGKLELDAKGRPVPPRPAPVPAPAPAAVAPKPVETPRPAAAPATPAPAKPAAPAPTPAKAEMPTKVEAEAPKVPVAPRVEAPAAAPTPAPITPTSAPAAPAVAAAAPQQPEATAPETPVSRRGYYYCSQGRPAEGPDGARQNRAARGFFAARRPAAGGLLRRAQERPQPRRPQEAPAHPDGRRRRRPGRPAPPPAAPGTDTRGTNQRGGRTNQNARPAPALTPEQNDKQIQEQIKATLAKLSGNTGNSRGNRAKYRRDKRAGVAEGH